MKYRIRGPVTVLLLPNNRGGHSTVWIDTCDFLKFKDLRLSWSVIETDTGSFYAKTMRKAENLFLHHLIIGKPQEGYETDHKNGNTLDCRRDNLRNVPRSINKFNRHHSGLGSRKIRGLCLEDRVWQAALGREYLGRFSDVREAALVVYHRLLEIDPISATNYLRSLPDSSTEVAA